MNAVPEVPDYSAARLERLVLEMERAMDADLFEDAPAAFPEGDAFDEAPSPAGSGGSDGSDGAPPGAPPPDDDHPNAPGNGEFTRDDHGRIHHSQRNIFIAIHKLGVKVRYNELARRPVVTGLPGFGPFLDDAAITRLRLDIDAHWDLRISKEFFRDVVVNHAFNNRYHPVRDYFDGLTWDGVPRLDTWLTRYAGAEDTPYTRAVGRIVLLAAVRRVRQPGCKFDEMLILESATQGKSKSTALAVLAVDADWFTDELPLGEETKRLIEATAGKWIVEVAELRGMSRTDVRWLKGYLSRRKDAARMSYDRDGTEAPRQFILIATTNEETDYLIDATGNRRFWPVAIIEFDIELLRAERDQLWAEAALREAAGESIRLDPSLYEVAEEQQEERRSTDSMEILVAEAFGGITGKVRVSEAWKILSINRPLDMAEMLRFGSAMKVHGWKKKQLREDGTRHTFYVKGNRIEQDRILRVSYAEGRPFVTAVGAVS